MTLIERKEPDMTLLDATALAAEIEDTPDPDSECVVVWVESVRALDRQLAGAVDLLYEMAEAVVENQERTGSVYSHRVYDALAAMDAAGYRPSARGQ